MKKKGLLAIIIVLIGGVLLMGVIDSVLFKNRELIEVSYSSSGDMIGSYYSANLKKIDDSSASLIIKSSPNHSTPITTTEYTLDTGGLDELKKMILEGNMIRASKAPLSPLIAYDAATCSISFRFDNGESFMVSDNQTLSKEQATCFREIKTFLYSLTEGKTGITSVEPHELAFSFDGYTYTFLIDQSVTEEQILQLAGTYEFKKYGNNEFIYYPSEKLDVTNLKPAEDGSAGTLAYYEPWGNVVLFYDDFSATSGLYYLGTIENHNMYTYDPIRNAQEKAYNIYQRK